MRAALYARFSTDLQSDRSAEDQLSLCAEFARREGHEIVGRYADRAKSGTTVHGRDGLLDLLSDARAGRFEVVIVEGLDRLSRDQEDLAAIHKRLTFAGIEIVAVHDGRADAVQIGIRGLVSALFLTDLKHKIRRGMTGVVADGRVPGGNAYGYRPVPGQPGQPVIDPDQAAIVLRIFEAYASGADPRDIAHALNQDSVPSPRAARWNASTLNGNKGRGHGILTNPIYAGEIVWNRVTMVRNPDTGRRVSRPNPPELWRRQDAPHLRIISPDLWQAVQDRKAGRSNTHQPARRKPGPPARRILSGLLKCAECGGGMSAHDKRGSVIRVTCSTAKESGSCSNRKRYRIDRIEAAVIGAVVARLQQPDSVRAWLDQVQTDDRDTGKRRAKAERAVAEAQARLDRLQTNLIDGRIDGDFFDRQVGPVRAALAAARAALEAAPAGKIVRLHPSAITEMQRVLAVLARHLPDLDPVKDRDMMSAFRGLIDRVILHDQTGGSVHCEIVGNISPLIGGGIGDSVVAEDRSRAIPPMIIWAAA